MNEKRTCRNCNEEKSIEDFEVDNRFEDRTNRCRSCKYKSQDRAVRAYHHLHERAVKYGGTVEITLEELKKLFDVFSGICIYCSAEETEDGETFHVDHVQARSASGRDILSNLVLSCSHCNRTKHRMPVVSFFFKNEKFKDVNFQVLVHYLSITSGETPEAVVERLTNEHVDYEYKGLLNEWVDEALQR